MRCRSRGAIHGKFPFNKNTSFSSLAAGGFWDDIALDERLPCWKDAHFYQHFKDCCNTSAAVDLDPNALGTMDASRENFERQANLLNPSMFEKLARHLSKWSALIVAGGNEDIDYINNFVSWLVDCSYATSPDCFRDWAWNANSSRGGRFSKVYGAHGAFKRLYLIECVVFAFSMRGTKLSLGPDPYKQLVKRALRTLPPSAKGFVDSLLTSVRYA